MTDEALRALLVERGLGRLADGLMRLARPMVRVYVARADEAAIPVGASNVGTGPDLPPTAPWPTWHEPLAFVGQFNHAEVAPFDREGLLPRRRLVSFFYETNGEPLYSARWGLPPDATFDDYPEIDESQGWRILYYAADPATFVRHPIPPEVNAEARFPACAARFAAEATLPDADSPPVTALGLPDHERSSLIGLDHLINSGTWEEGGRHLLGYPYCLEDSPLPGCLIALRNIPYQALNADLARYTALAAEAEEEWQLPFQVGSSDQAEMGWAGGEQLHFCIEREALRARDFSRAWLTMQFL